MLLLLPASIVALATVLRVLSILSSGSVKKLSEEMENNIKASYEQNKNLTSSDARDFAYDKALSVYGMLQPLTVVYAVAPLIGALGTVFSIVDSNARFGRSGDFMKLSEGIENSIIPCIWGIGIALFAVVSFGLLKSRLFKIEVGVLVPLALQTLAEVSRGERLKSRL